MPQFHMPGQGQFSQGVERIKQVQAEILKGGSGGAKYFDALGPQGQPWKNSYVGFASDRAIFLAPPWAKDGPLYVERDSRFWKGAKNPKGSSIYVAEDSLVSKAVSLAYDSGMDKNRIFLKRRRQYIWQGFALEVLPDSQLIPNLPAHADDQGKIFPMIWSVSFTLHKRLMEEMKVLGSGDEFAGAIQCVNPENGIPFKLTKTKTGPDPMDVEKSVARLVPMALPQEYWAGLSNLYDLDKLNPIATPQEEIEAIQDAGLPMPPEAGQYAGAQPVQPVQPPQAHVPQGVQQVQGGYTAQYAIPGTPAIPSQMPQVGQAQAPVPMPQVAPVQGAGYAPPPPPTAVPQPAPQQMIAPPMDNPIPKQPLQKTPMTSTPNHADTLSPEQLQKVMSGEAADF